MRQLTLTTAMLLLFFCISAHAGTIYVHSGGDLQGAINSAHPGDTLILDAGATFDGISLPDKGGTEYITIETNSSSLPGPGVRVSNNDAGSMATITAPNDGNALITAASASY